MVNTPAISQLNTWLWIIPEKPNTGSSQDRGILGAQIFFTMQNAGSNSRFQELGMVDTEPIYIGVAVLLGVIVYFAIRNREKEQDPAHDKAAKVAFILGCVAMGRAIVRNPRIFLMDEPLSNLDAKLRTQMRAEILRLYQKLKTTFIYVTHDQTEAMTLGTKIVVMKDGVIQQVASPEELYNCPANTFVAGFIGMPPMNFFQGKCCRGGEYGTYLQIGDFAVNLTEEDAERVFRKGYMGEVITVGVRPEDLVLTEEGTEHEVLVYEMLGAETYLYFTYEGKDVALRTNADTPYRRGDRISFCLRNDKLHLFDGDTGIRI
jgi:multiple sugar transport system ATP-binding protein